MAGSTGRATAVLNKAISLHQDGEFEAAGRLYRRVLETQPKSAEALHLLGVAVTQYGRPERRFRQEDVSRRPRPTPILPA